MDGTQTEQQMELQAEAAGAEVVKQGKKFFSQVGLMYFLGTLVIYAVQLGVTALVKAFFPEVMHDPSLALAASMIPMYLIGMPLMILLIKRVPAQQVERHSMSFGKFILAFMMVYAVMYCSNLVGTVITFFIGLMKGSMVNNVLQNIALSVNPLLLVVFTVICAPVMEELIFRKLLVDRAIRYGEGVAVLLSGLIFGLFHGNLSQFAYAFTLGLFFGFIYVRTGNVKYTIFLHMIINFMGTVAGVFVLKLVDAEAIEKIMLMTDEAAMMQAMMEVLPGMLLFLLYLFCVLGIVIAGIVLFIVFACKKKFYLKKVGIALPKGKRFTTVIINVGMILFSLFWIVMIVMQLFE